MLAAVKTWKDPQFQSFALKYAAILDPTTEGAAGNVASFTTYLPLLESFLTMPEKAILLNVVTDLQLRVTFNTQIEAGLSQPLTAVTSTLYCQTYSPKLSVLQEVIVNDWTRKLVMEWSNTYTEVAPLTTTTSTNYTLTVPFLVYKTHFIVKNTAGAAGAPMVKVNNISMILNGVPYITALKKSRLVSNAAKYGTSSLTMASAQDDEICTIDWGVLTGRNQNSGTAFMQELVGTSVTLTHATAATADHKLFVVHEFFNTVAFVPGNGSLGHLMVDANN
jgi:hypothetical protein